MRFTANFTLLAFIAIIITSCAKEDTRSYQEMEQAALDAWIEKYVPGAIKMGETGIYYEVISQDNLGAAIEGDNWLEMNYTVKDLTGNIIYNRKEDVAKRQGQYTPYTHYTPDFLYMTDDINSLSSMKGFFWGLEDMKVNEVRRYYIPSQYAYSGSAFSNSVGYGGQFSLSANMPMIVDDMQVYEVIEDPEEHEQNLLMDYVEQKWGKSRADSVKGYGGYMYMRRLNSNSTGESIPVDSTALIYYFGEFLDGFIFDTNVDTVWQNSYGELRKNDPVAAIKLKHELDDDEKVKISTNMPDMTFGHFLKHMRYGDILQIAVTSRYAYSQNGKVGYRSTSSGSSYSYYNPYSYGYGGYGSSYYGSSYGGYGYGYDDYSSYMLYMMNSASASSSEQETVTEVKAYTPLVYTIEVKDPNADEDDD